MSVASEPNSPFSQKLIFVIVLLHVVGGVILFTQVGPWEAIRNVGGNGLIVLAWLVSAAFILRGDPVPQLEPIRYPVAELVWGMGAFAAVVALAANGYAGWVALPAWTLPVVICGAVPVPFIGLRYPVRDRGLVQASRRGWLALWQIYGQATYDELIRVRLQQC